MAIGINDLEDDDVLQYLGEQVENLTSVNLESNDDLVDFLKTRGIDDISKIKFEDDNGNIEERNWDSLTKLEKFNILNTPLEVNSFSNDSNELTLEEINLLNEIRQNNMTPSQYIQSLLGVQQEPQYKIDELSDDELFLLDLESRVGEISDELAAEALNNAKQNEELFNKQVAGIRKEYKEREDYQSHQQLFEIEQQQLEAYNQFLDSIISSIDLFNSIGNLDLNFDNSDKEELAEFMLSRDESGNNYLWQALQDPETLVKAAWFILNGEQAFNDIQEYFVNLIKLVSENRYNKGFEEGKNGQSKPQVVINTQKQNPHKQIKSIDDIDED